MRERPGSYHAEHVLAAGDLHRYAHYADLSQAMIATRCGLRPDSTLVRKWLGRGQSAQHRPMPVLCFLELVKNTETPGAWAEIEAAIGPTPTLGRVALEVFGHPAVQVREAEHVRRSFAKLFRIEAPLSA